jgi:ABC-type amino acid transport substrate-binding protein
LSGRTINYFDIFRFLDRFSVAYEIIQFDNYKLREKVLLAGIGAAAVATGIVWVLASAPHPVHGSYRIGWENAPPEQFRGSDGQPTGAVVELVREAARRRGIALQWVESNESSAAARWTSGH